MPILAIDTSSIVSGAAIATEDKLISEIIVQLKKPQSEVLMGHIQNVLKMAQVDKKELKAIAVNIGPGSFTGLRIGLITAKMMAYALNIPLVAINSGVALSYHHLAPSVYTGVFIDAQKGNAYFALYGQENGILKEVLPMQVKNLNEAIDIANKAKLKVIVTGDLVKNNLDLFKEKENLILPKPNQLMPRASNVAFAGLDKLKSGKIDDVMSLEPFYIRRSEAEELWEKRQK